MLNRIYTLDYIYRDGDIDHRRYMLQANIDRFVNASAGGRDIITVPFHSIYHRDTKATLHIEPNGMIRLTTPCFNSVTVARYSVHGHRVAIANGRQMQDGCESMYWDFVDSDVDQTARLKAYSDYLDLDCQTVDYADQCHILSILRSVRKTNRDEPVDKIIEKERSLIPD